MKNSLKKIVVMVMAVVLIISGNIVNAQNDKELLMNQIKEVSREEIENAISEISESTGKSEEEVIKQLLKEIKDAKGEEELSDEFMYRSSRKREIVTYLEAPKYCGDIYYQPASFILEYGHVSIYYSSSVLVESGKEEGVIKISRSKKKIGSGTKVFTIANVSKKRSDTAANWAYSRIGDKYSRNFFNNRNTSCAGDKNCSKLVWCAYKIAANVDIDSNGGAGVYPRDILNYKYSNVYKEY